MHIYFSYFEANSKSLLFLFFILFLYNMFKAILMGISSSTPTKDRNPTSLAVRYGSEIILFDAAEGVQQQFMRTKTSYMDVNKIFISHFHADHFLGLPGLLATMDLHEREAPVTIYGPRGIKDKVLDLLKIYELTLRYPLEFKVLESGIVYEDDDYKIIAEKVIHSFENYGFVFQEKDKVGKFIKQKALDLGLPEGPLFSKLQNGQIVEHNGNKIKPEDVMDYSHVKKGNSLAYFVDTSSKEQFDLLQNVDLVFHEAMFMESEIKQAKKKTHSVVSEVAKNLERVRAKKWILVNFSTRYTNLESLLIEAQQYFPNSELGIELKEYVLHN
jgi:ribonuclease Z